VSERRRTGATWTSTLAWAKWALDSHHEDHPSFRSRSPGATPLLLLPGELGRAETLVRALLFLEPKRPVFGLSYALGIHEPCAVADTIGSLAQAFDRVHIAGFSMGAQVARLFAITRPDVVASLVLVGAGAPDLERARRVARELRLLRFAPAALWRRRWRRELASVLHDPNDPCITGACGHSVTRELEQLLATMTRREFVDARERLVALDRVESTDFAGRSIPDSIPTLRLDLGADTVISPAERARFSVLEPRAVVETIDGMSHDAVLTLPPVMLSRIETWLEHQNHSPPKSS